MATGKVQHSAPGEVQGSSVASRAHEMRSNDTHERDKHLVQSGRTSQRSANPFLVTERREEKQLSISSRSLHVQDFILLKTLGTGQNSPCLLSPESHPVQEANRLYWLPGTFARVSLTRLRDQTDPNKVYALKVLRKADGQYGPCRKAACGRVQDQG